MKAWETAPLGTVFIATAVVLAGVRETRRVSREPSSSTEGATCDGKAAPCREGGADLAWKWPSITWRTFIDATISLLPSLCDAGVRGVMVSGLGAADAVRRAEPRAALYGAAGLNLWNHRTAARPSGIRPLPSLYG